MHVQNYYMVAVRSRDWLQSIIPWASIPDMQVCLLSSEGSMQKLEAQVYRLVMQANFTKVPDHSQRGVMSCTALAPPFAGNREVPG